MVSLKLFEILLLKPSEHVLHNLVLRNLLGRGYLPEEHGTHRKQTDSSVSENTNQTDSAKSEQCVDAESLGNCDKLETETSCKGEDGTVGEVKEAHPESVGKPEGQQGDEDAEDEILGKRLNR